MPRTHAQERKMKLNQKSGVRIAMTAAALVVSGTALIATAMADPIPRRCFGVNGRAGQGACQRTTKGCAGKGACKSTKNDCKGKNACKGQGWLSMLQDECKNAGGQYENS